MSSLLAVGGLVLACVDKDPHIGSDTTCQAAGTCPDGAVTQNGASTEGDFPENRTLTSQNGGTDVLLMKLAR